MLNSFFSRDNATFKLASTLILLASVLTLATEYFQLSQTVLEVVTLVSGVFALAAQTLQQNKVITRAGWFLFGYTLITYVAGHIDNLFPQGQAVLAFAGAVMKMFSGFTTQTGSDAQPPKSEQL